MTKLYIALFSWQYLLMLSSVQQEHMRLDEPGSLLETETAVSLQTAPALLGTALLKIPSFRRH